MHEQHDLEQVMIDLARIEEQLKSVFRQLNEQKALTESIHKLATSVEMLTQSQIATEKKVDGLTKDVEEIKAKPAKRWDLVITAIISAVMAFLAAEFGLK